MLPLFTPLLGLRREDGEWQLWGVGESEEEKEAQLFWFYVLVSMALVCFAGMMSGLTLGLMSLDQVDLEILRRSGSPRQKRLAQRIMPVLKRPHVLLCTLLVCNAFAAEALPLFLNEITDPVSAVIVSVTVVLFFGEIIPQAACSRYGLQIGAYSAPFVRVLIWICAPVAYPIGWLLDKILGKRHTALFRRAELKALVDIHTEGQKFGGQLSADEVNIIKGALDLTHKTAKTAMTPLDMVFMLPADALLDEATLMSVLASGHSRIPVHRPGDRGQILGILLTKELILVDKDQGKPVGGVKIRSLPYLMADTPLYDMLKLFEIGRSHMAVLVALTPEAAERRAAAARLAHEAQVIDIYSLDDDPSEDDDDEPVPPRASDYAIDFEPSEVECVGIITIEDVLEELLQSEIVDETDQYIDNLHAERVNAHTMIRNLPPHLQKAVSRRGLLPRIGGAAYMQPCIGVQQRRSTEEIREAGREAAEESIFPGKQRKGEPPPGTQSAGSSLHGSAFAAAAVTPGSAGSSMHGSAFAALAATGGGNIPSGVQPGVHPPSPWHGGVGGLPPTSPLRRPKSAAPGFGSFYLPEGKEEEQAEDGPQGRRHTISGDGGSTHAAQLLSSLHRSRSLAAGTTAADAAKAAALQAAAPTQRLDTAAVVAGLASLAGSHGGHPHSCTHSRSQTPERARRRTTNINRGINQQLDLLEPLLTARRHRSSSADGRGLGANGTDRSGGGVARHSVDGAAGGRSGDATPPEAAPLGSSI